MSFLDDESPQDQLKRLIAGYSQPAAPQTPASSPIASPVAVPNDSVAPVVTKPVSVPPIASGTEDLEKQEAANVATAHPVSVKSDVTPLAQQQAYDQSRLSHLQSSGAGEDRLRTGRDANGTQIMGADGTPKKAHPILGTIAKIGDIGLSSLFPTIAAQIPGTAMYHNRAIDNAQADVTADVNNQKTAAETADKLAQPELKQAKQELDETKANNTHEEAMRKFGLKMGANGPEPLSYAEMSPTEQAAHDLKASKKEEQDAQADLDRAKTDPNSPVFKLAQQRLLVAQENSRNAITRLGLSQAQFQNKLQEQDLVKPSGQTQSRGSAAKAALDIMPELEQQIRENAANLGPIMGRISRGEIALGSVDPKIQQLYSSLNSFYALNPAIHGFRNYELVKDMPSLIGGLQTNPEATIAGLEGLKPTLTAVQNEGKTFHHRIVEDKTAQTPAATPSGPTAFKIGADVYDIPPDKVQAFKLKHPDAVPQ